MTICPNCSAAALGTETASICTECVSATVAGATFSFPMLIAGAVVATVALFVVRRLARQVTSWRHVPATA